MSWRQFIASVVDSLAVPGALLAGCLVFRNALTRILASVANKIDTSGALRSMRGGPSGVQFEFDPDTTGTWTDDDPASLEQVHPPPS